MFRKTSRWTSRAMFSTVPGFDSPKASLLSEKAVYVLARAATIELLKSMPKGDSLSRIDDMIAYAVRIGVRDRWSKEGTEAAGRGGIGGGD